MGIPFGESPIFICNKANFVNRLWPLYVLYGSNTFLIKISITVCLQNFCSLTPKMFSTLNESGHPCDETIIYHRTRGGGRTKVRKQRKIHNARRAIWRQFSIFGVDWELLDMRDKIRDMKHARRTSKQKCKINDVHERVINNFKLQSLKIDKQPRLSVKPRLCTFNVEEKNVP